MNSEEMAIRITRLELHQEVLTALVHTLLPAMPPASKEVVLQQFQQYCQQAEGKVFSQDWPSLEADLMTAALQETYTTVQQALKISADQTSKT